MTSSPNFTMTSPPNFTMLRDAMEESVADVTSTTGDDLSSSEENQNVYNKIVQIGNPVCVAIVMLGLGCTTEFKLVWKYIKAPKQICTGIILQLVCLPIWGLTLSQIFMMSEAETMGAIIQASCPGGVFSNIASYWLDGDMDLSIVLTALSTILAMGTLPFWLFVLPEIKQIENQSLKIPFNVLGYAILGMLSPVIVGLLIKWKFPKAANILTKVCSTVGSLSVVAIITFMSVTQGAFFLPSANLKTTTFCVIFPLVAVGFGYLATKVPWLTFSIAARRTVAIETVMQNSGLALSIVFVSYSIYTDHFGPIAIIPFLYGIVQLGTTLLAVIIYLITKCMGKCKWLQVEEENGFKKEINDEASPVTNEKEADNLL